ncbi:MAG: hypothetical protein ACYSTS_18935 [Planctomycetota bacterium]
MDNRKMTTHDAVTDSERQFPYKELFDIDYFKKYRYSYYENPKHGFQLGPRNYFNLLQYILDIHDYNEQHAMGFVKRLKTEGKDWKNAEAIFSEIIVYRYYIRPVYEGLINGIHKINNECDIIIELMDGTKQYLEVFCVMPNFMMPSKNDEIVVRDVKTHTQTEMSSIRQKLLNKIEKQKQFTKPRDNFAVIELNESMIAGDFTILSSLSDGYKITFNKNTMETISTGYDWSNSVFHDESTKYLKGIIYFNLGDYQSRKIIMNSNYKNA